MTQLLPNKIFFTADTHFNHTNIIQYCNRPFASAEEMNETIITNWNSKIQDDSSTVYHLGDVGFGDCNSILKRLNGKIILILGSHDKNWLTHFSHINWAHMLLDLTIGKQPVTLCHYAMRVWNKSHYNAWHLYGHSHNRLKAVGRSLDVGVDGHNFFPWSWTEIKDYMKTRPNNFNFIDTFSGRGL